MLSYTLPTFVDDVTVKASYTPGAAGGPSATAWHVGYSGVEGLSIDYAEGETETIGSQATTSTLKASYAYSSFTLSYSNTEHVHDLSSQTDEEVSSWNLAYTVSDDLSIAYGTETIETEGSAIDEENSKINVSYTTGGVTLLLRSSTSTMVVTLTLKLQLLVTVKDGRYLQLLHSNLI